MTSPISDLGFYDEPSPFDTLETWERWLADLEEMSKEGMNVAEPIESAKRTIAKKKERETMTSSKTATPPKTDTA